MPSQKSRSLLPLLPTAATRLTIPAIACAKDEPKPAAEPAKAMEKPVAAPARDESLPPAEDQAKAALEKSPRHGEYVDVAVPGSPTRIRTWVSYPERKDKAPVVIVIHEIFGLSDW